METTSVSQAWADNSSFHMIDVGLKASTRRRAEAQGEIQLSKQSFLALKENRNPKGNVLALAEAAGIMAAKKTSDLIPLCHPLPLHSVHFRFQLLDANFSIQVFCEVRTTAQTGVEMEALCGINGALLTIYDLSKAVDPVIEIKNIRLNFKEGGKSGVWTNPNFHSESSTSQVSPMLRLNEVPVVVLTISDRASSGQSPDKSGPYLVDRLRLEGANILNHACVKDDQKEIQKFILNSVETQNAQLIICTGGTGLSPRDVTPEAIEAISTRHIPGFGELLRKSGSEHIATAWLSRSTACIIKDTLVIALPGSPKACAEALDVLLPILKHALHTISGGNHDKI